MFIYHKQYVYTMQTFFSTPKREKLLKFILADPDKELRVREISRKLQLNPGFVSIFLQLLKKNKMIMNNKINLSSPKIRAMKILFNVELLHKIIPIIRKGIKGVSGVGVYGAYAHGENTVDSDVDIWIKANKLPSDLSLARTKEKLQGILNLETDLYLATPSKLQRLIMEDAIFYSSLLNSFLLWGEPLDKF